MIDATLTGTVAEPCVELRFNRNARHPGTGTPIIDLVKALPARRWDPNRHLWVVTGLGMEPSERLFEVGFESYVIDLEESDDGGYDDYIGDIDQLAEPYGTCDPERPERVLITPRLGGYEHARGILDGRGTWQRGGAHWVLPLSVFADGDLAGVVQSSALTEAIEQARSTNDTIGSHVAALAAAKSLDDVEEADTIVEAVGDVPAWFGLELDPYQVAGAIAIAAGHTALCDSMGLGKTRQALAAAAIVGSERTVVVCPPVTLTGWQRETATSGLAWLGDGLAPPNATASAASPDTSSITEAPKDAVSDTDRVVVLRSGRKLPSIPPQGVVIVPDTLLAARPQLVEDLIAWSPDVVLVDEAHREKTWTSKRARAVRSLAAMAGRMSVAMTGTPLFANPVEMASPLAIAGHLDATFGGYGRFTNTYAKRNRFNQWVPRKNKLSQLRSVLDEHVWVRRTKADVLADMPPKSRRVRFVDVDPKLYRAAHSEVCDAIDDWLDELDEEPSAKFVETWCRSNVGMVTRLRRAAGMAKVPAATEMIAEWVEENTTIDDAGNAVYERPLIVWTHHREVTDAMSNAVPEVVGTARCILGGTPADERSAIIDAFQAGEVPVLVGSIHAAGVGITLTRSSDVLFVETDWTPAIVAQAEDRAHRRGQTSPVTVTTLIAPDTLDERIQATLNRKAEILDAVLTGADNDVAVLDADVDNTVAPAEILTTLVAERVAKHRW